MNRLAHIAAAICLVASLGQLGCAATATPAPPQALPRTSARELHATAMALAARGDDVRAEQYFIAARSAGYPRAQVLEQLIALSVRAARFRAALRYALEAQHDDTDRPHLGWLIANLYLALGQPADALRVLELTVRLVPSWAEPHYLRARLFRDDFGDYARASRAFNAYLARAPRGAHRREALDFVASHPEAADPSAEAIR